MKPGQLVEFIATVMATPTGVCQYFARTLRDEGLLTTGARGRNAPDATDLDASRLTIAILATGAATNAPLALKTFSETTIDQRFIKEEPSSPSALELLGWDENTKLEDAVASIFAALADNEHEFAKQMDPELSMKQRLSETDRPAYPILRLRIAEGATSATIQIDGNSYMFARVADTQRAEKIREELFQSRHEPVDLRREEELAIEYVGAWFDARPNDRGMRVTREIYGDIINAISSAVHFGQSDPEVERILRRYDGCDDQGLPLDPSHSWNLKLPAEERRARLREIEQYVALRERRYSAECARREGSQAESIAFGEGFLFFIFAENVLQGNGVRGRFHL